MYLFVTVIALAVQLCNSTIVPESVPKTTVSTILVPKTTVAYLEPTLTIVNYSDYRKLQFNYPANYSSTLLSENYS